MSGSADRTIVLRSRAWLGAPQLNLGVRWPRAFVRRQVGRDYLAEIPEHWRKDPGWRLLAQVLRLDPAFRAVYERAGSGGFGPGVRKKQLVRAVRALAALPDDAGAAAVARALAPFRKRR